MKALPFLLLLVLIGCPKDPIFSEAGTFKDSRDNHVYKSVLIGNQTWMAENLAYLPSVIPSEYSLDTFPLHYVYGYEGFEVSEAKASSNFSKYGVLYNWKAAITACPSRWHLPTSSEMQIMTDFLEKHGYGFKGSGYKIGKSMASTTDWDWDSDSKAGVIGNNQSKNNRSGFTALPGGYRMSQDRFYGLGFSAAFWSSSESDDSVYGNFWMMNYSSSIVNNLGGKKGSALSVRCIKDDE